MERISRGGLLDMDAAPEGLLPDFCWVLTENRDPRGHDRLSFVFSDGCACGRALTADIAKRALHVKTRSSSNLIGFAGVLTFGVGLNRFQRNICIW